jgi:hypothetical protein
MKIKFLSPIDVSGTTAMTVPNITLTNIQPRTTETAIAYITTGGTIVSGVSTGGGTITGGTNGLGVSGANITLGGALTGITAINTNDNNLTIFDTNTFGLDIGVCEASLGDYNSVGNHYLSVGDSVADIYQNNGAGSFSQISAQSVGCIYIQVQRDAASYAIDIAQECNSLFLCTSSGGSLTKFDVGIDSMTMCSNRSYFEGVKYSDDFTGNFTARSLVDADYVTGQTLAVHNDQQDPSGFVDGSNITISYNYSARTITLTGTLDYYWNGVKKTLTSPWTSAAHTASVGTWFLYSTDGTNITWSNSTWSFNNLMVAMVYYQSTSGATFAIRETHGLMPWTAHQDFHKNIGTYLYSGGLATSYTANTATDAAVSPNFNAAVVADEDLQTTIPALTKGAYTIMRVSGNTSVYTLAHTQPFLAPGTNLYIYVNNPSTGALTAGVANRWYNVYQILVPATSDVTSQKYRMIFLAPQQTYTTLAAAQAEDTRGLWLGNLTSASAEYVIYARISYATSNANGNYGKVTIPTNGITYVVGNKMGSTSVNGISSSNHATLSNLTWANSGHLGTNSSFAAFDSNGDACNALRSSMGALTGSTICATTCFAGCGAGLTGTAASLTVNNSANLGGLPTCYFIYGCTQAGTNCVSTGMTSGETAMYKSGFWETLNAPSMPSCGDWYWGLTAAHTSNSPTYNYSMQIAGQGTGAGMGCNYYIRNWNAGVATPWRRIYVSGDTVGGGGITWSGTTSDAIGTYRSSTCIVAEPNLTFNGTALAFNSSASRSICMGNTTSTPACILTIKGAFGCADGTGGHVNICGGNTSGTTGTLCAGDINVVGGLSCSLSVSTANVVYGGHVRICGGFACSATNAGGGTMGGTICIIGGGACSNSGTYTAGSVCICGGSVAACTAGYVHVIGGASNTGNGGSVNICGGNGNNGGSVCIVAANTNASGAPGNVFICAGTSGSGTGGNVCIVTHSVPTTGHFKLLHGTYNGICSTCNGVILYYQNLAKFCTVTSGIDLGTQCGTACDWIATSDCRLKTGIQPISNALSIVTQLQGVCYCGCDDERCEINLGLIAQDVEKILPEIVAHSVPSEKDFKYGICDDKLGLKYDKLTAVLIEAIKEQQIQINNLKLEINEIKNK